MVGQQIGIKFGFQKEDVLLYFSRFNCHGVLYPPMFYSCFFTLFKMHIHNARKNATDCCDPYELSLGATMRPNYGFYEYHSTTQY